MNVQIYKVELVFANHAELTPEFIKAHLEKIKFILPTVTSMTSKCVEMNDDNPLLSGGIQAETYARKLFSPDGTCSPDDAHSQYRAAMNRDLGEDL